MFKDDIINIVLNSVRKNFETEGRGEWSRSASAKKENRKTLVKTGRLKNSFKYKIATDYIEIYSDCDYAGYNQFGTRYIEKRPFLFLRNEDDIDIAKILMKELDRVWEEGR